MQSIGVNAIASATVLSIKSVSSSVTTYAQSTSGGATETITLGVSRNAVQNMTIAGTVTTSDVVTLTVYDAALSGGSKAVGYTVASGNTLSIIASGLASAINADTALTAAGITATAASTTVNIKSLSTNLTTYRGSVNSGATETVSLAMNMNGAETIVIGGSKTTGDVLTVNVYDQGLSGGKRAISYTALSGDTLTSITTALASAINGDSQLQAVGVSATSSGTLLTVNSVSAYTTTYTTARSTGATETITPGTNPNGTQTAVVAGTKTTGDVLTITVFDSGLSGGSKAVNYTVLSGDNLISIATGIASAINADAALSAIGVTAGSVNTVVNIKSTSTHATSYSQSKSSGATENIILSKGIGVTQAAHNNVNQVTNIAAGGATRFEGTTNKAIKSAAVASQAITISATAASATSFSSSLAGVPTETVSINDSNQRVNGETTFNLGGTVTPGDVVYVTAKNAYLPGGQRTISYTVKAGDSLGWIAYYLAVAVNADPVLFPLGFSGFQSGNTLSIYSPDYYKMSSAYSYSVVGKPTESLTLGANTNGSTSATVGGTITVSDVVSISITNDKLPGGSQTVSRTVQSGDTTSSIASALASSINGNSNLASIGMTAGSASAIVTITTAGTTYSSSTSGGATETITLGYNSQGNTVAVVGGTKTTGDVLTVTTSNASLGGGSTNSSYTVQSGDTLVTIAAGLAAALNANTNLQSLGVSATNTANGELAWSQNFTANPILPSGTSASTVSATDGANNTKTDTHQSHVNSPNSQTLTFDLNGNMTSDGTNSYKWDAANRLIEIDYPGSSTRGRQYEWT